MDKNVILLIKNLVLILIIQACATDEPEDYSKIVTSEILKKYNKLSGVVDDAKINLWDTYFLNHPNIGNTYDNNTKCGWETVHKQLIKDKSLPSDERFIFELHDLTVYPINRKTAWVIGKIKLTFPEGKINYFIFYDSLIKTNDGWRVFNSVVNSMPE